MRKGFFEEHQYKGVLTNLPEEIRPVVEMAYLTGWRIRSEILPLQWKDIDFQAGVIHLEPGTTKNREGRVLPMITPIRKILETQYEKHKELLRFGKTCPYVFHRSGTPIKDFYHAWEKACKAAGCPGMIPHDLRRTAIRAFERAGISEKVAMEMTGHKTRSVFDRYDIVSEETWERQPGSWTPSRVHLRVQLHTFMCKRQLK